MGAVHRKKPGWATEAPLLTCTYEGKGRAGPATAASFSACSELAQCHLYMESRGGQTLEAGLKSESSPAALPSTDLCRYHQGLCKLRACGASEQITGAPVTGVGPACASGGRARVWADSVALTVGPGAQLWWSHCLTSSVLHQWICSSGFVSTVPEGHPGLLLEFP